MHPEHYEVTLVEGVDTKFPFKGFVLGVNVKGDLFFEIEMTAIGGTTPTLIFDNAILGELFYVDGNFSARPMGWGNPRVARSAGAAGLQ